LTTSVNSRRPGDAIVLKRVFRDNFVTFRRRSKRLAFLESVNISTRAHVQISYLRDGHVTNFRHHSGPVSAKCLLTDSQD